MSGRVRQLLIWTPRVLALLYAAFVSIFALDVFGAGYSFWETLVALFMHLIATFAILIVLAIAWRWARLGGILFIGLGALYLVLFGGRAEWFGYLLLAGPLFLVGALFLLSGWLPETDSPKRDEAARTLHPFRSG